MNITDIMSAAGIELWGLASFEGLKKQGAGSSQVRLMENPVTVIVCLFPYYTGEFEGRNISRYAIVTDYHLVAGTMLNAAADKLAAVFPQNRFACFTDNSPIREVAAAELAGLGKRGLGRLLINERYGSYVFIGEIITDLALDKIDTPVRNIEKNPRSCIGCGRCMRLCPGDAIREDGIDRDHCRSAVSQKKGELSPEEESWVRTGGLVWGCDICIDACPANQNPERTDIKGFLDGIEPHIDLCNLERLMENRAFSFRGPEVLKRNLRIVKPE